MQIPMPGAAPAHFHRRSPAHDGKPLYEAIVLKARELQIAGATVLRGGLGYGHSSHLQTAKILRLSDDLPLVIEIVDSEEKIKGFLPVLNGMISSGLITAGECPSAAVRLPADNLMSRERQRCHLVPSSRPRDIFQHRDQASEEQHTAGDRNWRVEAGEHGREDHDDDDRDRQAAVVDEQPDQLPRDQGKSAHDAISFPRRRSQPRQPR